MKLRDVKLAAMATVRDTVKSRYAALSTADLIDQARSVKQVAAALEMMREFEVEEEFARFADSVNDLVETSDREPTQRPVDSGRTPTPESRPKRQPTRRTLLLAR